jgi:hypothetical protein
MTRAIPPASCARMSRHARRMGVVWTNEGYEDMAQLRDCAVSSTSTTRPIFLPGHWPFQVLMVLDAFWGRTRRGLGPEGVKMIMTLFRAREAGEPYQRGEDVAPTGPENRTENYTFQEANVDKPYHGRWKDILQYLSFSFGPRFIDIPEVPQMLAVQTWARHRTR